MNALLVVIVTFGLIFVVTSSLAQGFSMTTEMFGKTLRAQGQRNVMLLLSNFIVPPALMIGLASLIDFNPQVKMGIIVLSITAGSPFIPWLVARAKADLPYSAVVSFGLLIVTVVVVPLALPRFCARSTPVRLPRCGSRPGLCFSSSFCRSSSG